MTKNPHRAFEKERRAIRRRNHFARDLWEPQYKQRRVEEKNRDDDNWMEDVDEWYREHFEDTGNSDEDL
jgi:hypothetical protein